jgi:hypothetical protein
MTIPWNVDEKEDVPTISSFTSQKRKEQSSIFVRGGSVIGIEILEIGTQHPAPDADVWLIHYGVMLRIRHLVDLNATGREQAPALSADLRKRFRMKYEDISRVYLWYICARRPTLCLFDIEFSETVRQGAACPKISFTDHHPAPFLEFLNGLLTRPFQFFKYAEELLSMSERRQLMKMPLPNFFRKMPQTDRRGFNEYQ